MADSILYEQAARGRLQPHLQPDEQVLWVGRPDPESYRRLEMRRAANGGLLLALIMILAFVIFVAIALLGNPVDAETIDILLKTGAAYFLTTLPLAIGLPFLISVIGASRANKILYAITSQTLVWMNTRFLLGRPWTRRFSLAKVYNVKVEHHADGTGTIVFLDAIIRSGRHTRKLSFQAIPDVDGVLAIAQEAARQAGYEDLTAEASTDKGIESRWNRSTLHHALACLIDLPTLGAIGLLVLNDHALKVLVPSWLTGKLSDLAGLYFFPFLVLIGIALLEPVLSRRFRSPDRAMGLALILSGLWFLALKTTPASNAWAIALLDAVTGRSNRIVADPTDLIALAVLPLTWLRWRVLVRRHEGRAPKRDSRRGRWLQTISLALASLAALATPAQVFPYAFGLVFDVAVDGSGSDILYASLATRRIVKMEPSRSMNEWDHVSRVSEVDYTVETYRSQDGGHTWTLYSPVGGYLWADPHTPDRLYILDEEGLHRLEEGKERLLNVPFEALQVAFFPDDYVNVFVRPNQHALAFDPTTPGHLYLTDGTRLLASADGGETWHTLSAVAPARMTALAIAPSTSQSLYAATDNTVLRSDDGGDSWSHTARISGTKHIHALAIHPTIPDIIYAAGSGVFRSLDGGITWEHVYAEDGAQLRAVALHPIYPHLIYAAGSWPTYGSVGRVIFSNDGGDSWQVHDSWEGYDVAISPAAPHHVVLALGERGIAVQDLSDVLPPTPEPSAKPTVVYADALTFDPVNSTILYALGGDPPRLGRSVDGGGSWTVRPIPGAAEDPPIALASYATDTPEPVRLGAPSTTLVALGRYAAYRLTWRQTSVAVESTPLPGAGFTGERHLLVAVPSNPGLLIAAAPDGILRSEDGGRTWAFHLPTPSISPIWSSWPVEIGALVTSRRSPTVLYAAANVERSTPKQVVLRSSDGGVTWKSRSVLTDSSRLESLAVHPTNPDIVYGGGTGLYRSDDGGATWTSVQPTMRPRALAIAPGDPSLLYAVTDEGAARSSDQGVTWTPACAAGWIDGPAEFLRAAVAPSTPHPVALLAHPTRTDLDLPASGICRAQIPSDLGIKEGWYESNDGLPVFVEAVGQ